MCKWLSSNGFAHVPLHFSRFSPLYKLTQLPVTPLNTLIKAKEIALEEGLKFIYVGNVPGKGYENTYCPECNKLVVERQGYTILANHIDKGNCAYCKVKIAGVWE